MKKRITAAVIEDTAASDQKITIYDSAMPHFALVIIPSGTKTFYYIRKIAGKLKYIRIGKVTEISLPQARAQAAEISRRICPSMVFSL